MRISKEQKQEEKIFKLRQELDLSKKEVKSLKNKLATSERKRKSLMEDSGKKNSAPQAFPFVRSNGITLLNSSFR
jgi:predicted RNase H-like nuclease (RuvC/YqgF family)